MLNKICLALVFVGAQAFAPAAAPMLAQSKFASARPQYTAPMPVPAARTSGPEMNAVTEWDADGNPVTHYEMFDAIWLAIVILPWVALLVANPF